MMMGSMRATAAAFLTSGGGRAFQEAVGSCVFRRDYTLASKVLSRWFERPRDGGLRHVMFSFPYPHECSETFDGERE
jgi:hypothetical protein